MAFYERLQHQIEHNSYRYSIDRQDSYTVDRNTNIDMPSDNMVWRYNTFLQSMNTQFDIQAHYIYADNIPVQVFRPPLLGFSQLIHMLV